MGQTQTTHQNLPSRAGSLVRAPKNPRDNIQYLMTTPTAAAEKAWKRAESPPPAYDTLSHHATPTPINVANNGDTKDQKAQSRSGTTTYPEVTDDEAFARMLQEEEYRDLQKERDLLLALSLANGTADRGDVELAKFMAREYDDLIASTGPPNRGAQNSYSGEPAQLDISQWDQQTQQEQLDHLYALEMAESLRAEEFANDAGLAEAMRLQAEFDRETENHEAWEEYKKTNFEECVVCGDENHKEEFLRPCEHGYCEECLQAGFKNALASKTPLKCCKKNLSVNDCTGLGADFVVKYQELVIEVTALNPMYCCNAACAKFLPPASIVGEVGTCESCKTQTCRHCRKKVHPGVFCEEDQETKAVKELAIQKGWKTCPGCNHLIERQSGCLHMICSRCQTAFCYRCSKRWNDCESTCPDRKSLLPVPSICSY
jgi:IBR domain, a half RING-finger domain